MSSSRSKEKRRKDNRNAGRQPENSGWTNWEWNGEYNCYCRQNPDGEWEYDYGEGTLQAPSPEGDIRDVDNRLQRTSIAQQSDQQRTEYNLDTPITGAPVLKQYESHEAYSGFPNNVDAEYNEVDDAKHSRVDDGEGHRESGTPNAQYTYERMDEPIQHNSITTGQERRPIPDARQALKSGGSDSRKTSSSQHKSASRSSARPSTNDKKYPHKPQPSKEDSASSWRREGTQQEQYTWSSEAAPQTKTPEPSDFAAANPSQRPSYSPASVTRSQAQPWTKHPGLRHSDDPWVGGKSSDDQNRPRFETNDTGS